MEVCLGVPYATMLWQVGDASEQNSFVKLEWYSEKAKLLVWKSEQGLPRAIRPEDAMFIMNRIFFKAYGNQKNNCKATAECGWFPPNRKMLEHPLLAPKQKETVLNVKEGLAGSVLDHLLWEMSRSDGAKKAAKKRKLTSDTISKYIKKSQRLISGVLANNAVHSLDAPRFLEPFHQHKIENDMKEEDKKTKRQKGRPRQANFSVESGPLETNMAWIRLTYLQLVTPKNVLFISRIRS
jgi:hypothetical protein